mmetsp:Transcript_19450/g.14120  ORF Transcript_19450/g.14120 Transcript_19450/m.14120 type:complete len:101 (-) Transcript_19450:52-354(-)
MIFTAFPTLSAAIYFQNISTEWSYYVALQTFLLLIATCIAFYLPQSPRYLLSKLKFEEAKKSFNFIAITNGKYPINFEEEMFRNEIPVIEAEISRDNVTL